MTVNVKEGLFKTEPYSYLYGVLVLRVAGINL